MKSKKVIIVGCRNPVFISDTAKIFIELGFDVEIAYRTTNYKEKDFKIENVTTTIKKEHFAFRAFLAVIFRLIFLVETLYSLFSKNTLKGKISSMLVQSWSVGKYINKKGADLVFVHAAFDFVLINFFLKKSIKSINMPWGADIYEYALQNKVLFKAIKTGLHSFDLIAPVSVAATNFLHSKYNIPFGAIIRE